MKLIVLIVSTFSIASTIDFIPSTPSTTLTPWSLSATSAFHGGGVGAGVLGGAGAGATRTGTMGATTTATTVPVMDTAIGGGLEGVGYSARVLGGGITTGLSAATVGLRIGSALRA